MVVKIKDNYQQMIIVHVKMMNYVLMVNVIIKE